MKIQDAAKTLGLSGDINPANVKKAFREMATKYHPDVAGDASTAMMQLINEAYESLKDHTGTINVAEDQGDYAAEVAERINAIVHIEEITIEVCGSWVWIHGTKSNKHSARAKEINTMIKEAGFKYHGKKAMWYTMPKSDFRKFRGKKSVSHEDIQEKYGSETVKKKSRKRVRKAS